MEFAPQAEQACGDFFGKNIRARTGDLWYNAGKGAEMMDAAKIIAQAVRRIDVGQGGAGVYELPEGRIAKHVVRAALPHAGAWEQYKKEAQFYARQMEQPLPFAPEVFRCEWTEEEILIVMRKYRPLEREKLQGDRLEAVLEVLAGIHALPLDENSGQEKAPQVLEAEEIAKCEEGWRAVLAEHGDAFEQAALTEIAEAINEINRRKHSSRRCFCHGDFHADNLLTDEAGNIIVCDWQNAGAAHPAADIAFLLSRMGADGHAIAKARALELYCRHSDVSAEEIAEQMALADLNTAFVFWHYYLHGAPEESVRSVYGKMREDMALLKL